MMKSSVLMFAVLALFCASQVSGRMRFGGFPRFRGQQNSQQGQESVRQGGQRRNPSGRQPGNGVNIPRAIPAPEYNEFCEGDNQIYMDCGDNAEVQCQPECKVRSEDDAREECKQTCGNDGFVCFCQRGFILQSGECVEINECPQDQRPPRRIPGGQRPGQRRPDQQRPGPGPRPGFVQQRPVPIPENDYLCGINEMYLACSEEQMEVRCEPECKVRSDGDEECRSTCTDYMCVCKRGFLLQNGACIEFDTCPEEQRPGRRGSRGGARPSGNGGESTDGVNTGGRRPGGFGGGMFNRNQGFGGGMFNRNQGFGGFGGRNPGRGGFRGGRMG